MSDQSTQNEARAAWLVGASFGGTNDQLPRFLDEGVWENGCDDKYLDLVKSMRPGDRIAIKSSYTRKHDLPFDNRGQTVSVMAIKAIGTITENLNDGKRVKVNWTAITPPREWYFFTFRLTVHRIAPGDWASDGLLAFTFEGKKQDLERFQNAPYWRDRFGTEFKAKGRFEWTRFYEAISDGLLRYKDDRTSLVNGLREIASRIDGLGHLQVDKFADGTSGFVNDICPFTTLGLFNRGTKDANRKIVASELAKLLDVKEAVPVSFEGIPVLNNQNSWFFGFEKEREAGHIDALWNVFEAGIRFSTANDSESREALVEAYDKASKFYGVAWNLTFGLYWTRPWTFLSLDNKSRIYLTAKLGMTIGQNGTKKRCNAADYLGLMDALELHFEEDLYPVHSYPELALEAWLHKMADGPGNVIEVGGGLSETGEEPISVVAPIVPYSIGEILADGCFLEREEIERLLARLRSKKNLILQGAPGTGKTWIARRLGYALIGTKDESRIRAVQFHPNLSYEDFVRGWRPTGEGKLSLVDGVFMNAIRAALKEPSAKFVVVIEEINRGNPAQIFGELLTLLEPSKRTPAEAIELCYPDADGRRRPVHIPDNLYLIGTMNIADRSLALVDLALRRRFAFVQLDPKLGATWRKWVVEECNIDADLVDGISQRIAKLNEQIASDVSLGSQFRIGHSYVTPVHSLEKGETKNWFEQVVETEIGPLLQEYWFDAPAKSEKARGLLIEGW